LFQETYNLLTPLIDAKALGPIVSNRSFKTTLIMLLQAAKTPSPNSANNGGNESVPENLVYAKAQ
jgi:hypothetical protein